MPHIEPKGVVRGHADVYSNASPGASTGCSPTTPGPRTSSVCPSASVINHARETSWTVSRPSFAMRIRYAKKNSFIIGRERSGT